MKTNETFCPVPFQDAHVIPGGNVYLCCPGFLKYPAGNIYKTPLIEIFNSPEAQTIRKSILNGEFTFCNKAVCPGYMLTAKESVVPLPSATIPDGPKRLFPYMDDSCNLSCPSCRQKTRFDQRFFDPDYRQFIADQLLHPNLDELFLTAGEPLFSVFYRKLMTDLLNRPELHHISLRMTTNGLLWKNDSPSARRMMESLRPEERIPDYLDSLLTQNRIREVTVSIDAASRDTYRKIRKGGDWGTLMESLAQMAEDKQRYGFQLMLNFVVQKDNYREMQGFVELAKHFRADEVNFQQVRFRPEMQTYMTLDEFQNNFAIHRSEHPEYQNFLSISQPLLSENIAKFHLPLLSAITEVC